MHLTVRVVWARDMLEAPGEEILSQIQSLQHFCLFYDGEILTHKVRHWAIVFSNFSVGNPVQLYYQSKSPLLWTENVRAASRFNLEIKVSKPFQKFASE